MIMAHAGGDNTALFEMSHPSYVRSMLPKYCIGELETPDTQEPTADREDDDAPRYPVYEDDSAKEKFYHTVKKRVERTMRDHGVDPRVSAAMYIKTACILTGLAVSSYGMFYADVSFFGALMFAIGYGFCQGEVGVSIQHDANHGCYSRSPTLSMVMGWTLDLVGASSFMWRQQHVVGHHAYTNVVGVDPDIRVNSNDVRRVAAQQPHRTQHRFQHVYLLLLYGLLAVKSVLVDDFSAIAEGCIGHVKLAKMTPLDLTVFWMGKIIFFTYAIFLPMLYGKWSVGASLGLLLVAELVCGWVLAFMFQVAHVQSEVDWFERDGSSNSVVAGPPMLGEPGMKPGDKLGWGASQVLGSADFCHGSLFWTHVSGGLNYQIVHHLFPGICHCHYPLIAPVVKRTCDEFGIRYTHYTTFIEALRAHVAHLKRLSIEGSAPLTVPSLQTVG